MCYNNKPLLYVFDFDGTLTNKDSMLELMKFKAGTFRFYLTMLLFFPLFALMIMGVLSSKQVKERLLKSFFKGMKESDFINLCSYFTKENPEFISKIGKQLIADARKNNARIIVISASAEYWIRGFLPDIEIQSTQLEVINGYITGNIIGKNCKREEKVNRLKQLIPNYKKYYIMAFGDSKGDLEMLSFADKATIVTKKGQLIGFEKELLSNSIIQQATRFFITGVIATALQFMVYFLLVKTINPLISNTIAYIVSFIFNYFSTLFFTFKVKNSTKRGVGFMFAHAINYTLQTLLLAFFIYMGMQKNLALLPVYAVCVPINFFVVRFFMSKK